MVPGPGLRGHGARRLLPRLTGRHGAPLPEHALVRPPPSSFAEGLTRAGLGAPDLARALRQHALYAEALRDCGLEVTVLEPDPAFPDSTFVEDTAVLVAGCAIVTRPGAPVRRGETAAMRAALRPFFERFPTIEEPGTLDGGDVCLAGDQAFIGVSERTDPEGARQLASFLAREGLGSALVDIRALGGLLHLKSGLSWLGGRRLLCVEGLLEQPAFRGWDLVPVPPREEYAANCVWLDERVLVADGFPGLAAALRALGFLPLPLDMSEFRKMDGGPSCLSLRF